MSKWIKVVDVDAQDKALTLARGCYQRALLTGGEALSGSTLRGTARSYGQHYAQSRKNLLKRMTRAGVPWREEVADHGRRVLVLG